mgnify:CR=1 FL=1
MKKSIILLCIMIIVFVSVNVYNSIVLKEVEECIFNGLNTLELDDDVDTKVIEFVNNHNNKYFVNGEDLYLVCENVSLFEEYCEKANEIESISERDPFAVIENYDVYDSKYDTVLKHYNLLNEETKNSDVLILKDNKYYVKYKDISFDGPSMEIRKGKFKVDIVKSEINKTVFPNEKDFVQRLGHEKVNGRDVYYYYCNKTNQEIIISVDIRFGILVGIERL